MPLPIDCTKCLAGDRSLPHVFAADSQAPRVAICIPVYDHPEIEFWRSLTVLWKPSMYSEQFPGRGTHNFDCHATEIVRARNDLTEQALAADPPATHVLFVDADMQFPPHALRQLVEHDLPIVGGLCHNRRPPYNPIVVRKLPEGGAAFLYDLPERGLVECDFTGAGFLLIKREVFEAIGSSKWWSLVEEMPSEDFSFCHRARAAGYKIAVDCGLDIGHKASVMIDRRQAEKLREFRWAAWENDPGLKDGKPVATIVIPTYNQQPRLLKAAVLSASHQTVPVEVIIVDDGSSPPVPPDGWPENVTVLYHTEDAEPGRMIWYDTRTNPGVPAAKNKGISAAFNTGIRAMQTEWFCWLSSDDLLSPEKVEKQLASMRVVGARASYHRYQIMECDEKGRPVEDYPRVAEFYTWTTLAEQAAVLAQGCAFNGSTVMVHRSVLAEVGEFDTSLRYSQDWEYWCRAALRGVLFHGVGEILGTRREVATNLTRSIAALPVDDERRARRDAEDAAVRDRMVRAVRG